MTTHATELTTFCVEITIMFLQCGKHVRSNYIITQLVNYGDKNLRVE